MPAAAPAQGNTTLTGVMDIHWHEAKPDRILFQGKVRRLGWMER